MIFHDIEMYIEALAKYHSAPGKIINGEGFVLVDDEWIPAEEYRVHNSRPVYQPLPRSNPDGTCIPRGILIPKSKRNV
jgi:hypothetical protein